MADDAGVSASDGSGRGGLGHAHAGGIGGQASHGISSGADHHLEPRHNPNFTSQHGMSSRVSTFELLESGMQTPMPVNKRASKIDLEDYFVSLHRRSLA